MTPREDISGVFAQRETEWRIWVRLFVKGVSGTMEEAFRARNPQ